jgi:hypothetical protein
MEVIQLPTGTQMRGLHLKPPHGMLIADGIKTHIAKAKPFDLSGPWILVSGGIAYGTMNVGEPVPVAAGDFDGRFSQHRVTIHERRKWWEGHDPLYLSEVSDFVPFERQKRIVVTPSMQTVVERVQFQDEPPAGLEAHCKRVQTTIEGTDKAVVPEEEGGDAMPYDPAKPPAKLSHLPAKQQRQWVHVFNSCMEKYNDEGRCHQMANGVVDTKKAIGEGQGVGGPRQGLGGPAECVCPACGTKSRHEPGVPCAEEQCPKCGTALKGSVQPQTAEKAWTAAYVNDLPDSAFLYVEEGEKDDEGKTKPRRLRHLPYKDEDGNVDLGHLRNAIARANQIKLKDGSTISAEKAEALRAKARNILTRHGKTVLAFSFKAKDGRDWLLTWTTNAFEDRERETFRTKALEAFVDRHAGDRVKGEYWFWHMPGTKFADILWQAVVGRFLVEAGPFDDTPMGKKMCDFFTQYPVSHPDIAPEGWGTSHGYYYVPSDRKDRVYDWFEKFETTVLPERFASNQHSPRLEVLTKMNKQQEDALETIGGPELLAEVLETGQRRTEELEEKGTSFKAMLDEVLAGQQEDQDTLTKELPADEEEPDAAPRPKMATAAAEEEDEEDEEADEAAKIKTFDVTAVQSVAQQIIAGLNLDKLLMAIKSQRDSVDALETRFDQIDERLKALEESGVDAGSPLIPMPRGALWRASQVAQTETEEKAATQKPTLPDAIQEMAKMIPA